MDTENTTPTATEETTENTTPEGGETTETTEVVDVTAAATNGRKKHAKPVTYITDAEGNNVLDDEGNPILAEKLWGNVTLPARDIREFMQFCRDTNRKPSEVTSHILAQGMITIMEEVNSTKEAREAARPVKVTVNGSDPAKLAAQAAKLEDQQVKLAAKLEAIKARAAALKAGLPTETPTPAPSPAPEEGTEAPATPNAVADLLANFPTPAAAEPVQETPAPAKRTRK